MKYQAPPPPDTGYGLKFIFNVFFAIFILKFFHVTRINFLHIGVYTPYIKDPLLMIGFVVSLLLLTVYWIRWLLLPISQTFTSSITLRQCYESHTTVLQNLNPFMGLLIANKYLQDIAEKKLSSKGGSYCIQYNYQSCSDVFKNRGYLIIMCFFVFVGASVFLFSKTKNHKLPDHWILGAAIELVAVYFFAMAYLTLVCLLLNFLKRSKYEL